MNKYYLLFLIFINLSCFQEIELELNSEATKITSFFSLITKGKDNKIRITNTQPINGDLNLTYSNLKLEVSNKNFSTPFEWVDNGKFFISDSFDFLTNTLYTLKLFDKNELIAQATDYIPSIPTINDVHVSFINTNDGNDRVLFECKIIDAENQSNYYEFTFVNIQYDPKINVTNFSALFDVSRTNIVLDNESDLSNKPVGFLFSDQLFKDSTYNFSIELNATQRNYITQTGKTSYENGNYLIARSISKNYYEFNKSWNAHNYNKVIKSSNLEFDISTIFPSTPSALYSNSSAGIGGVYGYQEVIIQAKKK